MSNHQTAAQLTTSKSSVDFLVQEMADLSTLEGRVRVFGDMAQANTIDHRKSLVFYLLTKNSFNENIFVHELGVYWNLSHPATIEKIAQNLFLEIFRNEEDYVKVKEEGPWVFHNNLILFADWDLRRSLQQLDFRKVPFWVQFYNLLVCLHMEDVAVQLANQVEDSVSLDRNKLIRPEGPLLYTKIMLDVFRPLMACIHVE